MRQEKLITRVKQLKEKYGITYIFFAKAMGITKQRLWGCMQNPNNKDYRKMTEQQIEKIENLCDKLEKMMKEWEDSYMG